MLIASSLLVFCHALYKCINSSFQVLNFQYSTFHNFRFIFICSMAKMVAVYNYYGQFFSNCFNISCSGSFEISTISIISWSIVSFPSFSNNSTPSLSSRFASEFLHQESFGPVPLLPSSVFIIFDVFISTFIFFRQYLSWLLKKP